MRRAAAIAFALVLTLLLVEAGVRLAVAAGALDTPVPRPPQRGFWDGNHPIFGVWHRPGATVNHDGGCFDVTYRTNRFGARDRERALRAEVPRVVALGDSFVEGWGIGDERRLTNLLEARSGIPHLNFGMAHFGPYQSFLAYRELARTFDHDAVLVGVVPHNDFTDLDFEKARHSPAYQFRYRPYLRGEAPSYSHFHYRENAALRWLRQRSFAYHAIDVARRSGSDAPDDYRARPLENAAGETRSDYYDYDESQLGRLRESLARIARAAEGRPVVVFLIPTLRDFVRSRAAGPSPLPEALERHGSRVGYRVFDLLPGMEAASLFEREYYFRCDYHWNERGNATAARLLGDALETSLYPELRTGG